MRSNIKIIHLRRFASKRQGRCCYYCKRAMGSTPQLRCTAEHLVARAQRGNDSKANIVAACKFCNAMRHRGHGHLLPDEYAVAVRTFVRLQQWHERHPAWESLA